MKERNPDNHPSPLHEQALGDGGKEKPSKQEETPSKTRNTLETVVIE